METHHPHLRLVEPPADCEVVYLRSDNIRRIRPIPAHHIEEIFGVADDERLDLYRVKAANDLAYREAERMALGGRVGLGLMMFVCIFVGLLLATGGQL